MQSTVESDGRKAFRWRRLIVMVAVVAGIAIWLILSPTPRVESIETANLQGEIDIYLRMADSLLLVGDRDHDMPDIAYSVARQAIARADSLAAEAGLASADSTLRERADISLMAARAALVAKSELFSDLPRLAADINVRLYRLDSLMDLFSIRKQQI